MSSFSSVIRKPGQKIVPKSAPRRNAQPRVVLQPVLTPESQPEESSQTSTERERHRSEEANEDRPEDVVVPNTPYSTAAPIGRAPSAGEAVPEVRLSNLPQIRSTTSIDPTNETSELEIESTADSRISIQDVSEALQDPNSSRGAKRAVPEREEEEDNAVMEDAATSADNAETTTEAAITSVETQAVPESLLNPRKRRKITPVETPGPSPDQATATISPTSQSANRESLQPRSSQSQSPEELFRSATSRAASVSELANSIDDRTRAQRRVQRGIVDNEGSDENGGVDAEEDAGTATPTQAKRKRRKKTIQEQAAEVVASAMGETGRKSRKRNMTPEGAETYELNPDEMTMGNLCRNSTIGKKSALEAEMQANWPEILQRRKEDHDKALEAAQSRRRKAYSKLGPVQPLQATVAVGPQQMIVNGKIVVVTESREIDRNAQLTQAAVLDETNVREDKHYYKRVNQATVGIKANHSKRFRWDDESTQKFFKGLRMFGTDFMMIANMFPGLDRKQIKTKFIREENLDKAGVMAHLQNREEVDLEEYSEVANIEFQDVQAVEDGIKADEQRLRAEDNERRKREGFVVNEADVPLPSREGEDEAADGSGTAGQTGEEGPGRFSELAAEVMAPKKKQRKTNVSSNKRGPKAGRRPEVGVEEILGSIDEVRV